MTRRSIIDLAAKASFAAFAVERLQAAVEKTTGRTALDLASDEDFWFEVRHAFSIDRNIINLNNGSVCPSPRIVQEAREEWSRRLERRPSLPDQVASPWVLKT